MAPGPNERILDATHNRRGRWVTKSARDPVRTAVGSPGGGTLGSQKATETAGQNAGGSGQASDATSESLPKLIKLPHGCLEPGYLHLGCSEGDSRGRGKREKK